MKKTIKIIDLLNKIANGEEVPKKIKVWGNTFFRYEDKITYIYYYATDDGRDELMGLLNGTNELNNEAEIIGDEEDKKIDYCKSYEGFEGIDDYIEHLRVKIDNLIDAITELKGKSE